MTLIDRKTKLKARRLIRKQKRLAETVTEQADEELNRLFFRRFGRLHAVRRFVAVWTFLVLLLGLGSLWQVRGMDSFYLETTPVDGGVYREGILGAFTNANPLFATSSVDTSVSKLLFSGLFKVSPSGQVVGDLAQSMEVDARGITYTVKLKENVYWQDGKKFSADDVVFTYQTIQDPSARSPLRSSWQGVKIAKVDDATVVFTLPSPLSSFSYALINGIVPKHILGLVEAEDLRSSSFNTVQPVGTGMFQLKALEVSGTDLDERQERIALVRNEGYFGDKPGLDSVVIRSYREEERMLKDFQDQVIQSMVGLNSIPDSLKDTETVNLQQAPLTSSVMVFLNNSSPLLQDKKMRQALLYATDSETIRRGLGYDAVASDSPFLKSQFAYNPETVQLSYDPAQAGVLLDELGWIRGSDGMRTKDGKQLSFKFVSQSLSEYASITQKIQQQWKEAGIKLEAVLQPEVDIQTNALARHDYDVLLYGISIGYDPDVFAYWHSSQADPNSSSLNLAEYKDSASDIALEAGRTRLDEELRKVKYQPFLDQWRDNAPAKALYQPRFFMVTRGTFVGFESGSLSSATDRYWSIADWKIRNADTIKE
jgi:peptide/nickel transport system substrate-binding protein